MPNLPTWPLSRFLWAQGPAGAPLPAGTVLAERYQVIHYPLIRDSQPDVPPTPLESVPPLAEPYLALSRFSVTIPRPFTQVTHPNSRQPILLLEEVPLQDVVEGSEVPTLLPTLSEAWEGATALHQLTWLWRLAKLWQPCLENHVAHNLLDWQNVRVDEEDIRLLLLDSQAETLTLADLGKQWHPLTTTAASSIREFLSQLTQWLLSGKGSPDSLVYTLIQAIEALSPQQTVTVQLANYSDQGPTRQRNEDACYPKSGFIGQVAVKVATADMSPVPLVVVCDGVGGHQGGDVASNLAISAVTQYLSPIAATANLSHQQVVTALKQAILAANQSIADRNDAAQRQDRNRMGTTIVIALVYGSRLYIAHLGDSRAYRVRSYNCRQITLDDDVAAREMRLGLELYQDALQNPGSGALVQALGMADSTHLRPTVMLYPIATNSLFVLCSDGLSDNDLLRRIWQTELIPVLTGDSDVATVGKRLIELANTQNGHDNVTVSLLRLLPDRADPIRPLPIALAELLLTPPPLQSRSDETPAMVPQTAPQTRIPGIPQARWRVLPTLASLAVVAILVSSIGVIGWQWFVRRSEPSVSTESTTSGETLTPSALPPNASQNSPAATTVGDYLQIRPLPDPSAAATMLDIEGPPVPEPPDAVGLPKRLLAVGSIVQVMSRQKTPDDQIWVRLRVCSISLPDTEVEADGASGLSTPSSETDSLITSERDLPFPLAQSGDQGWLLETQMLIFSEQLLDISSDQQGVCTD